ncbi:YfhO family protein [Candidatus Gottesmanbacteria bacterium]|nr:YfhO family protein [Candidatus Gottesmanbacteria bacterium]
MVREKTPNLTIKEALLALGLSLVITAGFFYKSLVGLIPFPGDLLLAEYKPWRTYSYQGYNPGSIPNKAQYPDVLRQLYPWKTLSLSLLKEKQLPLWNPYNFSGSPMLANFQSAPFYPLNFFYAVTSQVNAWIILVALQPLLAMWFMYLYGRRLGLKPVSAWFSAASYGFCASMAVIVEYNTIGHVMAWLPLVAFSLESIQARTKAIWLLLYIVSLASAALAGHPQLFAYLLAFAWIYIGVRIRPWKQALSLALFSLLSIGIAAIQYIPGIELIGFSARSSYAPDDLLHKLLIQPWQLAMLQFPNIFGNPATRNYWPSDTFAAKVTSIGLIPLFFLPALWRLRSKTFVKFILISLVLLFILVTNNPLSFILAQTKIPFWSTSNPTLMVFLLSFVLSIGSGIGIDAWTEEKHSIPKLTRRTLAVVGFFVLLSGFLYVGAKFVPGEWPERFRTALKASLYAGGLSLMVMTAFAVAIFRPKLMTFALIALFFVHLADLWLGFQKFNPFVPKSFVYPPAPLVDFLKSNSGINRFWGYGNAAVEANLATQVGLYSSDGYDPLYPRWYGEFISGSREGNIETQFTTTTRSDAVVAPGFGIDDLPKNMFRLRVLDTLGIRYILDRFENASTAVTFPPDRFKPVYNQDGWIVYENLKAAPRIFLATNVIPYKNTQDFEKSFFSPTFDSSKEVLVPASTNLNVPPSSGGIVQILSYQPNSIRIQTSANSDALLFVSDTYYPGWKASIDSVMTPIHRADYAFRAILVPKGNHTVTFEYLPDSLALGEKVSIISLGLTVIILLIVAKRTHTS